MALRAGGNGRSTLQVGPGTAIRRDDFAEVAELSQGDPKFRGLAWLLVRFWERRFRGRITIAFDGHGGLDVRIESTFTITGDELVDVIAFESTTTK